MQHGRLQIRPGPPPSPLTAEEKKAWIATQSGLTVGSDAHTPGQVGGFFPQTAEILKSCGFRYYTVYHQRKPVFYPL